MGCRALMPIRTTPAEMPRMAAPEAHPDRPSKALFNMMCALPPDTRHLA